MQIYKGHILFTKTPDKFDIIERGYIVVENGKIREVCATLPEALRTAEVVDFGDKLIIPAMNDLHVHAPQYRNMGMAMDMELLPWLDNYTFPEEAKYADVDYADKMYRRFVKHLWKVGTMRTVAFATVHKASTIRLMELFEQAGMGAMVGKVNMNRNCPDALCETVPDAVAADEELINTWNDPEGLVHTILTPRFVPSCTPEMLTEIGRLAHKYNMPVQSHLSENKGEIAWVKELEPASTCYGDAYRRYGLFGQTPTLMAHCCYTAGEELELMKKNRVFVVHCPLSNCDLGSGMAPIRTFLQNDIPVALGSDISGGHHLSMFQVMVYAVEISKLHYAQSDKQMAFLTLPEVFYLATKSGGSFFGKVGSFESGYDFDALVIDDAELNHDDYTLAQRLERFIYIGDDRQIAHRYVRGNEVLEPTW
ncbi:MAG: amidohydrolase family protein [Paludibacteraceae bacterium]|nr:amidohydrolase family protein [Paludibacteraceae bacterium]